ncbi:hypothetical protein [Streptomyces sp. H27-H1]|uniref:hypothetical protein n=1 Tax=Streptomyces sp. H27-H1 TaxID=2996461 RepID=UPI00226D7620|nr:hypothetical protein [Streptomyces sp. H27-H1]
MRTLLETAVTCRNVDEVAELVTLLRGPGKLPDVADEVLRAAAVSRPIEDVVSLALLLDRAEQAVPRPQVAPHLQAEQAELGVERQESERVDRTGRCEPPPQASEQGDVGPDRNPPPTSSSPAVPGRGLRWLVAAALTVSALLYLPRHPSELLAHGDAVAWLLLGAAVGCLALGVLVTVRDHNGVWAAATVTGIGLLAMHALAAVMGVSLMSGVMGGLLPWPTGISVVAAGLAASLSVTVLLYRSQQPKLQPAPTAFAASGGWPAPQETLERDQAGGLR